ncbi:MAG: acyl-CoA reductase [Clostridia bacterium]|nr:acyl-CoA reductase [Clostridia bacterium]
MILYRGQIRENSAQQELLDRLPQEVYRPLCQERQLSAEVVIAACDRLVRRVQAGEFDHVVRPFLSLFSVSDSQFADMLRLFTREGLTEKCRVELRDEDAVIDGKILRRRYPLGVLLHIAAGNVDILPAYSVVEGLLAGNVNILKLPMGDSGLSVQLLAELVRMEPVLEDYVYVFDVPSTETATLKALAELCDGVAVWGGDAAVKAARQLAGVNTKIIAWGHKLSFAYATPDAEEGELEALAEGICDTNQLLCSSCQGIFVDTDSPEEQMAFAERFFSVLRAVNRRSRPVDYGMMAKNAIHLYNERLEQHRTGTRVLAAEGVSVLVPEDSDLSLSYLYRNVWVKRLPFAETATLKRYKGYLQTAAVLTPDPQRRLAICRRLAAVGVVRLTSPGRMSRMACGEAHDGTYALREYSRIVETDIYE